MIPFVINFFLVPVNIVIVSDHGMKDIRPEVLTHLELDDYLDTSLVEMVIESGAFMNIKVLPGNLETVRKVKMQICIFYKDSISATNVN